MRQVRRKIKPVDIANKNKSTNTRNSYVLAVASKVRSRGLSIEHGAIKFLI